MVMAMNNLEYEQAWNGEPTIAAAAPTQERAGSVTQLPQAMSTARCPSRVRALSRPLDLLPLQWSQARKWYLKYYSLLVVLTSH